MDADTSDLHAGQNGLASRFPKALYLLVGTLDGLLGIRFVLSLLGANPAAGLAPFVYGITRPFLAPFVGLFGTPRFGGSVFEWNALAAIIVYGLFAIYAPFAWILVEATGLVLGDTYRSMHATTRQTDERRN